MAWKDERWIVKAAAVIIYKYAREKPEFPPVTGPEYDEAYAYMDRVLTCVNACAEVELEKLRALKVKDLIAQLEATHG